MKLPGWQSLGGSSQRYINPQGENVSRREYLNAQARSVGYSSYSQYQGQTKRVSYQNLVAANPEARRLDSQFNSTWAKQVLPKLEGQQKISTRVWSRAFEDADYPDDFTWEEFREWYKGEE